MTAATFDPVNGVAGNTLGRVLGPVPAGEEWSIAVRICAVGTADSIFDLSVRKSDGSNSAYRAKSHPVILGSGTFDIETRLTLPAGYELWHRSGNTDVAASYTGTKRSTV